MNNIRITLRTIASRFFHYSSRLLATLPTLLGSLWFAAAAYADGHNPIDMENALPGTAEWLIPEERKVSVTNWLAIEEAAEYVESNAEIEGYAAASSVLPGEELEIFVHTKESAYQLDVYRIGWYDGAGGRHVFTERFEGLPQRPCRHQPDTHLVECNWEKPVRLMIESDWTTGFYLAKLTALTSGRQNYVTFVVKDTSRVPKYLFLSAVNTYQAYNLWGGFNAYSHGGAPGRGVATKLSFDRPYGHWVPGWIGSGDFFQWEIQMVRWLERNGSDVAYGTNVDAHEDALWLRAQESILSVGHDEYWSLEMRNNFEAARDDCTNLGFFSANSAYWQIRYEPNRNGQPNRTLVAYKDVGFDKDPLSVDEDPTTDHLITTMWRMGLPGSRDPRPEERLLGVMYAFHPVSNVDMQLTESAHPALAGVDGSVLPGLVGYEADRQFGWAPPGTQILASTPITRTSDRDTHDCAPEEGNCNSQMTIYSTARGALVFATGTIQWSWGLDDFHAPGRPRPAVAISGAEKITSNVLQMFDTAQCSPKGDLPQEERPNPYLGISSDNLRGPVGLRLTSCDLFRRDVCRRATRWLSAGPAHTLIASAEEMQKIQRPKWDLPKSKQFTLLGPTLDIEVSNDNKTEMLVWLSYDDKIFLENKKREKDLKVLFLDRQSKRHVWRAAETTLDVKLNAIQARIPFGTTLTLALPK
jgi:N,N-dimethylformamidase beta subunit-like protein